MARYFEPYPSQIGSYTGYREISSPAGNSSPVSGFGTVLQGISQLGQTVAQTYRDIKMAELQAKMPAYSYSPAIYNPVPDSKEVLIVPEAREPQQPLILIPQGEAVEESEESQGTNWEQFLPLLGLGLLGMILIKGGNK